MRQSDKWGHIQRKDHFCASRPLNGQARVKILIWKWRIMVGTNQTERELLGWGCARYHRMKAIYVQRKIHTVGKLMGMHWQQSKCVLSYWVEQRSGYQSCPIPFRWGDLGERQCQCTWAGMRSNQGNSHNYHHSPSWHPSQWLWCHLMQLEHKRWNTFCLDGSWLGTEPKSIDIDWMSESFEAWQLGISCFVFC